MRCPARENGKQCLSKQTVVIGNAPSFFVYRCKDCHTVWRVNKEVEDVPEVQLDEHRRV